VESSAAADFGVGPRELGAEHQRRDAALLDDLGVALRVLLPRTRSLAQTSDAALDLGGPKLVHHALHALDDAVDQSDLVEHEVAVDGGQLSVALGTAAAP